MADFRVAAAAEATLGDILGVGDPARRRYAARLVAAMQDVADNLRRPAIVWHPVPGDRVGGDRVGGDRVGVYHVGPGRDRVEPDPAGDAGHYLVLRATPDGVVDILGLIAEPMLSRRAVQRVLRANRVRS